MRNMIVGAILTVGAFSFGQHTVHPAPIQFRNVHVEWNNGRLYNCWDEVDNPRYPNAWDKYCNPTEQTMTQSEFESVD